MEGKEDNRVEDFRSDCRFVVEKYFQIHLRHHMLTIALLLGKKS